MNGYSKENANGDGASSSNNDEDEDDGGTALMFSFRQTIDWNLLLNL